MGQGCLFLRWLLKSGKGFSLLSFKARARLSWSWLWFRWKTESCKKPFLWRFRECWFCFLRFELPTDSGSKKDCPAPVPRSSWTSVTGFLPSAPQTGCKTWWRRLRPWTCPKSWNLTLCKFYGHIWQARAHPTFHGLPESHNFRLRARIHWGPKCTH